MPKPKQLRLLRPGTQGYENIDGTCGMCGVFIIVNRATDLGNASFAGRLNVECPNCHELLRIGGDTANHPIDLLLFDTYPLRRQRRYMQGITALAQVLEITMFECSRFVLVARPIMRSR